MLVYLYFIAINFWHRIYLQCYVQLAQKTKVMRIKNMIQESQDLCGIHLSKILCVRVRAFLDDPSRKINNY